MNSTMTATMQLTQSSGKGCILSHMTDGPVSWRKRANRRSNPSNCCRICYTPTRGKLQQLSPSPCVKQATCQTCNREVTGSTPGRSTFT